MRVCRSGTNRRAGLLLIGVLTSLGTCLAQSSQPVTTGEQPAFYWLKVTADRVNLRSRADLNSRIVGRVCAGELLRAVGREYGWFRIIPTEEVYSVVAADYIERTGPHTGIVRVDTTLRVRVGSDIQPRAPLLSEVQTRLTPGSVVEVIGPLGEGWLKIRPPRGVYVYVSEDYVERISDELARELRARSSPTTGAASTAPATARPATAPAATSRPATVPAAASRPTASESCPIHGAPAGRPQRRAAVKPPPEPLTVVVGLLEPCFDLQAGPYGMRYQILSTDRRHVLAYVEFPPELGFEAPREVGKYVRIEGVWRRRPHVKVRIMEVRKAHVIGTQPMWQRSRGRR